jgi:serine/threonine-protein kinase
MIEDATSLNTVKDFLSAPYASPEQWRGERVTKASDIYAFGCLIYALRTGRPPFSGPEQADYARQHLMETPPALEGRLQ